jgi:lysophospholipase L1-like esterase
LGESTTFGAGVLAKGTYSAQLERNLEEVDLHHVYTVINAGVSAYSSFQSLKYLELRGLRLKPDLVLFYHEYNDSLETIGRDGGPKDEASLAATDMQLYQSRRNSLHRALLARSATYRFITYFMARHRIERPSVTPHPVTDDDGKPVTTELPVRVAPAERRQILEQLHELCEKNRIALVVIHPSYRDSDRHRCILTNVCADHHVLMFEAYDSLHPSDADVKDLYLDDVHPNVIGHARLARDLCSFLVDAGLVPITDETRPTR